MRTGSDGAGDVKIEYDGHDQNKRKDCKGFNQDKWEDKRS